MALISSRFGQNCGASKIIDPIGNIENKIGLDFYGLNNDKLNNLFFANILTFSNMTEDQFQLDRLQYSDMFVVRYKLVFVAQLIPYCVDCNEQPNRKLFQTPYFKVALLSMVLACQVYVCQLNFGRWLAARLSVFVEQSRTPSVNYMVPILSPVSALGAAGADLN